VTPVLTSNQLCGFNGRPERLLVGPVGLDAGFDAVEDELADVAVVGWPVGVVGVRPAGVWWWVEVVACVVAVRMPVPATRPRLVCVGLLVVDAEIVVSIPPNLEFPRIVSGVVCWGEGCPEVEFHGVDEFDGVEQFAAGEPGVEMVQYGAVEWRGRGAIVGRHHAQPWEGAVELVAFWRARSWSRRSSIAVAQSPRSA
jgi:hypothetical protein